MTLNFDQSNGLRRLVEFQWTQEGCWGHWRWVGLPGKACSNHARPHRRGRFQSHHLGCRGRAWGTRWWRKTFWGGRDWGLRWCGGGESRRSRCLGRRWVLTTEEESSFFLSSPDQVHHNVLKRLWDMIDTKNAGLSFLTKQQSVINTPWCTCFIIVKTLKLTHAKLEWRLKTLSLFILFWFSIRSK